MDIKNHNTQRASYLKELSEQMELRITHMIDIVYLDYDIDRASNFRLAATPDEIRFKLNCSEELAICFGESELSTSAPDTFSRIVMQLMDAGLREEVQQGLIKLDISLIEFGYGAESDYRQITEDLLTELYNNNAQGVNQ